MCMKTHHPHLQTKHCRYLYPRDGEKHQSESRIQRSPVGQVVLVQHRWTPPCNHSPDTPSEPWREIHTDYEWSGLPQCLPYAFQLPTTHKNNEKKYLKATYQDWNSALVHSNLWSLFLKPLSPGRRQLNSEFGVLMITANGLIYPNTTSEKQLKLERLRCSMLHTTKEIWEWKAKTFLGEKKFTLRTTLH